MREIKGDGELDRRTIVRGGRTEAEYMTEVNRLQQDGWWIVETSPGTTLLARQRQRMLTEG